MLFAHDAVLILIFCLIVQPFKVYSPAIKVFQRGYFLARLMFVTVTSEVVCGES